ncbi:MAG: biotin transporter BioY [Dehalococcoidales bacterium]|nr:biotin transporter BioY [Dehalococcoidales bacterium]
MATTTLDKYRMARYNAYHWRFELSIAQKLALAVGIACLTGWTAGISHLAGPTGGYIIGFIFAALFIGHFTDKYVSARRFYSLLGLMPFGNFALVYIPGLLQLGLWLNLIQGKAVGFSQVLAMGLFPFIIGDIIKVVAAAGIAWGITTKQAFNREADLPR